MKTLLCLIASAAAAGAQPATAPLIVQGNAPLVELTFRTPSGGERKARFLVDTGGGAFILGKNLLADVAPEKIGAPRESGEGGRIQVVKPMEVSMGAMKLDLTDVRTLGQMDAVWVNDRNDAEGMIPGHLLKKYHVIFDYPGRTITFAKPGTVQPRGVKLKAEIGKNNGFPRIEAEVGGKPYGFLVDTGASYTMISRAALDEWTKSNPAWPSAIGAVGFANMSGGKMETEGLMLRLPEMKIAGVAVAQPGAVSRTVGIFEKSMSSLMPAPIIGAMGGNVWRDFRVEIDYANGFVYLEKSARATKDEPTAGLILAMGKLGLVVTGISSKAAADVKSGVKAGDTLMAVDGVAMSGKPIAVAAEALQGPQGSKKKLRLLRGGEEKVEVQVTCERVM